MLPELRKFHYDILEKFVADTKRLIELEDDYKLPLPSQQHFVIGEELRKLRDDLVLRTDTTLLSVKKLRDDFMKGSDLVVKDFQMSTIP